MNKGTWSCGGFPGLSLTTVGGRVVFISVDRRHQHLSESLFKIMWTDMCDWQLSALKINKPLSQKHGWQTIFFPPSVSGTNVLFCNKHNLKLDTWKRWEHLQNTDVCEKICITRGWIESFPDLGPTGSSWADTFKEKLVESSAASGLTRWIWCFLEFIRKLQRLHAGHRASRVRTGCRWRWPFSQCKPDIYWRTHVHLEQQEEKKKS